MLNIRKSPLNIKGQATVEFALVLPILIMLLMGIFEIGRIYGAQMLLDNLAREGARNGAVGYDSAEITTLVNSRLLWLDPAQFQVSVTPADSARAKGQPLTVECNYSVELMTPYMGMFLPDPVPLTATCEMRIE